MIPPAGMAIGKPYAERFDKLEEGVDKIKKLEKTEEIKQKLETINALFKNMQDVNKEITSFDEHEFL